MLDLDLDDIPGILYGVIAPLGGIALSLYLLFSWAFAPV